MEKHYNITATTVNIDSTKTHEGTETVTIGAVKDETAKKAAGTMQPAQAPSDHK